MDLSKTDQSSFAFFQKFRYALITDKLPSSANLEIWDSYDYFSTDLKLIIRMPTPTHETFCAKVTRNIQRQLDEIANSTDSVAVYARNVEFGLSPTLTFPSDEVVGDGDNNRDGNDMKKYNSHEPDSTFYYENMYWPCVVIEVSFSQKKEDLKGLAEDYILGSDGNTSVVIGLDIEYKISKQATISVWRPQFEITPDGQRYLVASQTVVDQVRFLFSPFML